MNAEPLESAAADAWHRARREAPVPAGFAARVLEALPPAPWIEERETRPPWWRVAALAAGGAWFLARVASLFLPFTVA